MIYVTAAEILALAGKLVDEDTIDFAEGGREWLNEGLTKLGKDAYKKSTTTIAAAARTWYDLPGDALVVDEVLDAGGKPYEDYDVAGGQIRFADAGTYSVTCRRLPAAVTAKTATPEVHAAFHPVLALFVAGRYRTKEADADPEEVAEAARLMGEFNSESNRVAALLRRQARRAGKITVQREANPNG